MKFKPNIKEPERLLENEELDSFMEYLRKEIPSGKDVLNVDRTLRHLILCHKFSNKKEAFKYLHFLAMIGVLVPIKRVPTKKKSKVEVLMEFNPNRIKSKEVKIENKE